MLFDTKETLKFLTNKKIDANQLLLCLVIFHKDDPEVKHLYSKMFKTFNHETIDEFFTHNLEMINDLEEKGYIEDLNPIISGSKLFYLENFITTLKFEEDIFIDKEVAAKELWKAWPTYGYMDSKKFLAKTMNYDVFINEYHRIVKSDLFLHKEILEKTNFMIQTHPRKSVPMGIEKYLGCRHWENIKITKIGYDSEGDLINSL